MTERIPFPNFDIFPSWDRIKRLGQRAISYFPLDAPAYMSTHNRGGAVVLDAALNDEWEHFDLRSDVAHQFHEDHNRWDDMGNYHDPEDLA